MKEFLTKVYIIMLFDNVYNVGREKVWSSSLFRFVEIYLQNVFAVSWFQCHATIHNDLFYVLKMP